MPQQRKKKCIKGYLPGCNVLIKMPEPKTSRLCYFDDHWSQKQTMKRYVRRQKALEDVVAPNTGTRNKEAQKNVVAFGGGDIGGNMRGLSPIMSTTGEKNETII